MLASRLLIFILSDFLKVEVEWIVALHEFLNVFIAIPIICSVFCVFIQKVVEAKILPVLIVSFCMRIISCFKLILSCLELVPGSFNLIVSNLFLTQLCLVIIAVNKYVINVIGQALVVKSLLALDLSQLDKFIVVIVSRLVKLNRFLDYFF